MKKILLTMTVVIIAIFMCTGCMSKKLEYDPNLGYDLNNVKNKDVTFNVYHSNTKDHTWELVTSFQCDPKPGHYNDVKIEGKRIRLSQCLVIIPTPSQKMGNLHHMMVLIYRRMNMWLKALTELILGT